MKFLFGILLLSMTLGFGYDGPEKPQRDPLPQDTLDVRVENMAFGVNEYLLYELKYGFINAGSAILRIPDTLHHRGHACYRILWETRSNDSFSKIFPVNNYQESWVDMQGIFPWYLYSTLNQGSHKTDDRYEFYPLMEYVHYNDRYYIDMPIFTQNIVSLIYFLRTQNLERNRPLIINSMFSGKLYPLHISTREIETIDVPVGEFECYVIEPTVPDYWPQKKIKGNMKLWLTRDKQKIPVRVKTDLPFGSITMNLVKARGLQPFQGRLDAE